MLSEKVDYQHVSTEPDDVEFNTDLDLDLPELESPTDDCKEDVLLSDPLRDSELRQRPSWLPGWASRWKREPSYQYVDGDSRNVDLEKANREEEASTIQLLGSGTRERCLDGPHWVWQWIALPLPSFLHRFIVGVDNSKSVKRSTDYLDGIRGVASLFVFIDHYISGSHEGLMEFGYGQGTNHSFFQLPFIKLLYAGSAMVAMFFIVSGYVLSHRCILHMRSSNHTKVYTSLTSMAFRRGMRLFVPSVIISFITYLTVLFGFLRSQVAGPHWTIWKETKFYFRYLNQDLFKLWTWEVSYRGFYSRQLWTIPLEFKCSMVLFLVILAVSRCKAHMRLAIETMCLVYLFHAKRWDVALFIAGALLAEMNIISSERQKRRQEAQQSLEEDALPLPPKRKRNVLASLATPLPWLVLILGLFIAGYPHGDPKHTPGYAWLATMWRSRDDEYKFRFWLSIGAILFVGAVSFLPSAQRFFTTRIARYLGKNSYGLYLVHGVMGRTIRPFLWGLFWKVVDYEGDERGGVGDGETAKYEGGWILGTLVYMPLVLWAADVFTRAVDGPTVRLAKWVEGKCFVREA